MGRKRGLTVEVRGPDKGDVDTEVAVVRGAIEAEVDAEGDRRPCRVLLATVEADLPSQTNTKVSPGPGRLPGLQLQATIKAAEWRGASRRRVLLALLAGFDFNFSKIFSDCCLLARTLILAVYLAEGSERKRLGGGGQDGRATQRGALGRACKLRYHRIPEQRRWAWRLMIVIS